MAYSSLSTELLQMVSITLYIQNYMSSHLQSTVFMVLYDSLCMCEEDCHSDELSRCSLEAAGYRKDSGYVSWVQASSSTSVRCSSFNILTYHPTLLPPTPSRKRKSFFSANCLIWLPPVQFLSICGVKDALQPRNKRDTSCLLVGG